MTLDSIHELLTVYLVFPLISLAGIYLSVRLRFIQIFKIKQAFRCLFEKDVKSEGDISHFAAISSVLAGNLGTGNMSGVAVALATGGPGSLVWMWIMAFFGSVIKYAGCLLGVQYRIKEPSGEYKGGPMYYISNGLGSKPLGVLFAIFAIMSALTVGNLVQVNSMTLPLGKLGIHPLVSGVLLAIIVAIIIIGGIQRISRVAMTIVPLMTVLYLGVAIIILFIHRDKVLDALQLIFTSFYDPHSLTGGMLGYGFMKAISSGFERGIFATDAGTGIAPVLQAGAKTKSPVDEGLVGMIAPLVVMVVCTITGLVLIVTDAWQVEGMQSTNMCALAFQRGLGHDMAKYVVIVSLMLFGLTTILAWAYCAEKAMEFLVQRKKYVKLFQYAFIMIIPFGALFAVKTVWVLADISVAMMLIMNMVGVIGLSRKVIDFGKG